MSVKDMERAKLLHDVSQGNLSLKEASQQLRLSYRQAKRLYAKYKQSGAIGIRISKE